MAITCDSLVIAEMLRTQARARVAAPSQMDIDARTGSRGFVSGSPHLRSVLAMADW
jgi:hypothetical protein